MKKLKSTGKFVLCVRNENCDDLELRKVYPVLDDPDAAKDGFLRVIDESEEDYLYPSRNFVRIALPREAENAMKRPLRRATRMVGRQRSAQSR